MYSDTSFVEVNFTVKPIIATTAAFITRHASPYQKAANYSYSSSTLSYSTVHHEWRLSKKTNRLITEISIYLTSMICLVGLIGNVLSLKVFFSTKLPRTSSRTYFIALAITDGVFLFVHFVDNTCKEIVQQFKLDFPLNITDQRQIMCRTFALIRATCRCISPWILTIFTLERFLQFSYPQVFSVISKPLFAKRVVLAIICLSVMISAYNPILMGVYTIPVTSQRKLAAHSTTTTPSMRQQIELASNVLSVIAYASPRQINYLNYLMTTRRTCDVLADYRSLYLYLTFGYTIIVILIPISVVSIFNSLLILRLYKSKSSTDKWKNAMLYEEEQGISYKEIREKKLQIENLKITWMLVIVSLSFILLTLPHVIVYFMLNISHLRKKMNPNLTPLINIHVMQLIEKITELLYILNYGINFFLYILTRHRFRQVLLEKLKCRTLFGTKDRNSRDRRRIRFV